jgi:hypothetical protein
MWMILRIGSSSIGRLLLDFKRVRTQDGLSQSSTGASKIAWPKPKPVPAMSTALGHPRQSAGNVRTDRHRTFDAELHRTCGEMRSESPRIPKRWPREANESPFMCTLAPTRPLNEGANPPSVFNSSVFHGQFLV